MVLGNDDLVPERGTNTDAGIWIDRAGERVGLVSRTTAFASTSGLRRRRLRAKCPSAAITIGRSTPTPASSGSI